MTNKPRLLKVLDIISIIFFFLALLMVFFYAPLEKVMGAVQKVFYFHVSAGWVGMISFMVAAIAGIIYLVKRILNGIWSATPRLRLALHLQ